MRKFHKIVKTFKFTIITFVFGIVFWFFYYSAESFADNEDLWAILIDHNKLDFYIVDFMAVAFIWLGYYFDSKMNEQEYNYREVILKLESGSEQELDRVEFMGQFGSFEFDLQTYKGNWSKGLRDLIGSDPFNNHFSLEPLLEVIHEKDRTDFFRIINEYIHGRTSHREGVLRIVKDNTSEIVWIRYFLQHDFLDSSSESPFQKSSKSTKRMLRGIFQNITAMKELEFEAEKQSLLARQNMEALNETAIVAFTDQMGKLTYVNENFVAISGYTRDELLGKTHKVVNSGFHDHNFFKEMWKEISSGKIWKGEIQNRKKNGTSYWVNTTIIPLKSKEGIFQYVAIRYDITKQKETEVIAVQRQEELIKTSKIKSNFLANMSHEIRTPMNAIIGITDLLSDTTLNDDQQKYIQVLRKSGDVLLSIINDILDISKIESGQFKLDYQKSKMSEVSEEVLQTCQHLIKDKDIQLQLEVDKDMPKEVLADSLRIKQILFNLLANSIKFTEKGSVSLSLKLNRDQSRKGNLLFVLKDTGIGIAKNVQGQLFQPFIQADSSVTKKFGGTGLGLALSRHLSELMGGEIWLESELGIGTTFYFTIQAEIFDHATEQKIEMKNEEKPRLLQSSENYLNPFKILIVDDTEDNRFLMRSYLKNTGFPFDEANNGEEAFGLFTKNKYDLILMDIQMPVMDGYTATQKIREYERMHSAKPSFIIALTAFVMKEEQEKCLASGCDIHMAKPIKRAVLLEKIKELTLLRSDSKSKI